MDQCKCTVIKTPTSLENRLSAVKKFTFYTATSHDLTRAYRLHSHPSRSRDSQTVACKAVGCTGSISSHRRDQNVRHIEAWNDLLYFCPKNVLFYLQYVSITLFKCTATRFTLLSRATWYIPSCMQTNWIHVGGGGSPFSKSPTSVTPINRM